jgi:hypothetical protein
MADLLGSILGSMEKPPVVDSEKKKAREQKALLEKLQQQEKDKLSRFRAQIQKCINEFVKDGSQEKHKFEVMDKVCRAIVHEVADVAGLASFSFGQEEVDRCVIVWKKEFAPSDEEFAALRAGEEWNPEKARLKAVEKEEAACSQSKNKRKLDPVPSDYHQKYEHILGKDSAKDAARVTSANKSYGFVPSENKRDQRTIEQVMAESRARKKQKTAAAASSAEPVLDSSVTATAANGDGDTFPGNS